MLSSLLGASNTQIIMYVVVGVVLVLMIVLTIIPQKKRQKEQQNMMSSLAVGTKIMTIGRMVGKITQINADNTLIVNVGTENNPTLIVIDKNAVGLVLEKVAAPAPAVQPVVEDAPKAEEAALVATTPFEDAAPAESAPAEEASSVEDAPAETAAKAPAKKSTKKSK
jgi:preprotein translocase subunit YajC